MLVIVSLIQTIAVLPGKKDFLVLFPTVVKSTRFHLIVF
jgi:hypothetical protein